MKYGRGTGREGKRGGAESREAAAQNLKTLAIAAHTGTHTQTHTQRHSLHTLACVCANNLGHDLQRASCATGRGRATLVESCCLAYWQEQARERRRLLRRRQVNAAYT